MNESDAFAFVHQSFNPASTYPSASDDALYYASNDDNQPTVKVEASNKASNASKASKASTSASKASQSIQSIAVNASSRCKGNSCHQCKTTKDSDQLYFCTARIDSNSAQAGRRCCRKKYCLACMTRWYKALLKSGEPGVDPAVNAASSASNGWLCPSCIGACVCAACDRKKEKAHKQTRETSTITSNITSNITMQFDQSLNTSISHSSFKRGRTFTPTLSGTNSPIPKTIKTETMSFEQSINQSITRLHTQLNMQNNVQTPHQTAAPTVKLESINELCLPPMFGSRQVTEPCNNQLNRQPIVSRAISANAPINALNQRSWPTDTLAALTAYYQTVAQVANQPIDQSGAMSLFIESQRASAQRQQFIQHVTRPNRPADASNNDMKHVHEQMYNAQKSSPETQYQNQLINRKMQKQFGERSNSISSMSSGEQSVINPYFNTTHSSIHTTTPPLTVFSSGSSQVSTPKTFDQPYSQAFNQPGTQSIRQSIDQSINDIGDMHLSRKSRYDAFSQSATIDRSHYPPLHTSNTQSNSVHVQQSINQPIPTIGQLFESFSALVTPLCSLPGSPKHQSTNHGDHTSLNQSPDADPFHPSSLYHAGLDCSVNLPINQSLSQFEPDDLCGDWSTHIASSHEWIFSNQ